MVQTINVSVKIPIEMYVKMEEKRIKDGYATISELIRVLIRKYLEETAEIKVTR